MISKKDLKLYCSIYSLKGQLEYCIITANIFLNWITEKAFNMFPASLRMTHYPFFLQTLWAKMCFKLGNFRVQEKVTFPWENNISNSPRISYCDAVRGVVCQRLSIFPSFVRAYLRLTRCNAFASIVCDTGEPMFLWASINFWRKRLCVLPTNFNGQHDCF